MTISKLEESVKSYLESVDYEKGEVKFWHLDYHPETGEPFTDITIYNFDEEFPEKIERETVKVKAYLDAQVTEINKNGKNHTEFLKSQVSHTTFLIDKLSEASIKNQVIIHESLEGIIGYIIKRYSIKHTKKVRLSKNNKNSFFDLKPTVKMSIIVEIYDLAVDLELIDDEVVAEESFVNVLTGSISDSQDSIIFKCNNQLAVLFIDCIQPLFNSFTYSHISKSEKFYNKAGKLLKQADLDTAKSRLLKKTSFKIDKITTAFKTLIES